MIGRLTAAFSSRRLLAAGLLCVLCGWAGCGGSEATVRGVVTLDGQPLADGIISMVPVDGQGATAGDAIKNGKYSLTTTPGAKRVEITANKVVGRRQAYEGDPNSPWMDIVEPIVPPRYNRQSELTCELKAGGNGGVNFDLLSAGAGAAR